MNKIWIIIFGLGLMLWACDSKTSENGDSMALDSATAKPNWQDADTLEDMIHKHFFQNTAEKGQMFFQHRDPATGEFNMIQVATTKYDSVFQTSENSAVMSYNVSTDKQDSLVMDCMFIWDASFSKEDKTFGRYKLKELMIRRKNGKDRYAWKKTTKYWEKVFAEQPNVKLNQ